MFRNNQMISNKQQESDRRLSSALLGNINHTPIKAVDIKKDTPEDKMISFYEQIKNKKEFEEKIKNLFVTEFEEKIPTILLTKETEFIGALTTSVKMILENLYTLEIFQEKAFREIFEKTEKLFRKDYYAKNYKILSTSWNDYETNAQAIRKYSSSKDKVVKISTKNQENFSFLKHFRKHCKYSDSLAFHNCKEGAKMLQVYDESKDNQVDKGKATHVICSECKQCYFSNCIQLNCNHCKVEYYSSVLEYGENSDIQPATWSKYHCGMLINDKMRCIKCRQVLYTNLKTDTLICLNKKCNFEGKPNSIMWVCVMCKKEFNSEVKIYNPLDFKPIRNAIQLALSLKQRARPHNVPCCDVNIYTKVFYHKKECQGEVFQGRLDKKPIVVCSKCKSMNFYEKYIWTCPICNKRFQDRKTNESELDCSFMVKDSLNDTRRESIKSNYESERFVTPRVSVDYRGNFLQASNNKISNYNSNNFVVNNNNRLDPVMISNRQYENYASIQTQIDDLNDSRMSITTNDSRVSSKKHKSLMDVLQERKSSIKKESISILNSDNLKNQFKEQEKQRERADLKKDLTKEFNQVVQPDLKCNENTPKLQNIILKPSDEEKKKISSNCGANVNANINHNNQPRELLNNLINLKNKITAPQKEIESKQLAINPQKDFNSNLKIEDFHIIKQIGEGSYGKIYLVEDKSKKQYAMKKILAHDRDELAAIRTEFELLNSIKHDNIMKIFGIIEKNLDSTTFALYIIMEKALRDWDQEIRERLEKKTPYTEEELFLIIKQLVEALAFLQKKNISHRDIKPMNVLVFENNVYKLADFGEAKEVRLTKQLNTLRGTEIYMSPILFESLKENKEEITHNVYKSDVFSLGYCLLYAATLSFQSINEVRDLKNMKSTIVVLNKYLKSKYTSKIICLVVKMIDVYERTRLDFVDLENYLKEKILAG
jgi:tRNA A-37 threonylcarbamoyl transferase component Bud32